MEFGTLFHFSVVLEQQNDVLMGPIRAIFIICFSLGAMVTKKTNLFSLHLPLLIFHVGKRSATGCASSGEPRRIT